MSKNYRNERPQNNSIMVTGNTINLICEDCFHKIGMPSLINQVINFNIIGWRVNETLGKTNENANR